MTSHNSSVENTCPLFDGDTIKCDVVVNAKRIISSLSITGSVFTLGLVFLFQKYREPSQWMIANLSFASLLYGVAFLVGDIPLEATWLCKAQGSLISLCAWAIWLWNLCILFNLYFQLLFEFHIRKFVIPITAVCWILPVLLMSIPFVEDAYGPAGVWCWIKNDFKWRFGYWYIFRILFVIVTIIVAIHISCKLQRSKGDRHSSTASRLSFESDMKVLRLYPIVYFVLNLFPIASRIYSAIDGSQDEGQYNFVLLLLQAITDPILGAAIGVVYVLDSRTRQSLTLQNIRSALQRWGQEESQVQEYSGTMSMENVQNKPS